MEDLVAPNRSPVLCEAKKEPLLAGLPVDYRSALPVERRMVRIIGNDNACVVGDVLAKCKLPVQFEPRQYFVGRVLRYQRRGALLVFRRVRRCPPVRECAASIELATLVIEAVTYLMTYDCTD